MYRVFFCFLCTAALSAVLLNEAFADEKKTDKANNTEVKATPVGQETPEFALMVIEKNVIEQTNAQRSRHGLPPLEMDENLVESAREHAIWMARCQTLQHTRKMLAENIAMGYRSSQQVVTGWMNSSGHRANILNPSYRRIGVAAYQAHNGSIYWCQQFMR